MSQVRLTQHHLDDEGHSPLSLGEASGCRYYVLNNASVLSRHFSVMFIE